MPPHENTGPPDVDALEPFVLSEAVTGHLADPNVSSVGIGWRRLDAAGAHSDELCIQFTVDEKLSDDAAIAAAGSHRLPDHFVVEGRRVGVDVIRRRFRSSDDGLAPAPSPGSRQDPVRPGASIGRSGGGPTGTLGLIVFDRDDGTAYGLSNWHVLATGTGSSGDATLQPGRYDHGQGPLGNLVRSVLNARVDAALTSLGARGYERAVPPFDVVPRRVARARLGDRVFKFGRTRATAGAVRRVAVTLKLTYPSLGQTRNMIGFEIGPSRPDWLHFGELSQPGDSGAGWLRMDDAGRVSEIAVGLHVAGEDAAAHEEYAFACELGPTLDALHVSLEP